MSQIFNENYCFRFYVLRSISFPELRSPWPAVGKRELWEHPFQVYAIDNIKAEHRSSLRTAQWNRKCEIRLFPLLFQNECSQSSRFPTAGQGEQSSGNEIFLSFVIKTFWECGVVYQTKTKKISSKSRYRKCGRILICVYSSCFRISGNVSTSTPWPPQTTSPTYNYSEYLTNWRQFFMRLSCYWS